MAPKKPVNASPASTSSATHTSSSTFTSSSTSTATSSTKISSSYSSSSSATAASSSGSSSGAIPTQLRNAQDAQAIVQGIWTSYIQRTPPRTKLLDAFMAFLVVVGGLQFVYCVLGGTYPFNAFLAGFSATVGQFVLTASLRIQTDPENGKDFASISHERAFADFVFGSMILHFFCVNFIN